MDTWSLENYTVDEYIALKDAVASGEVEVDGDAAENDPNAKGPWENVTVIYE